MGRLDRIRRVDDRLGDAIRHRRTPGAVRIARLSTHAGSWVTQAGIPAIALVSAARGGSRRRAVFAASAMLGTSAIFHSVKHATQRDRPHSDWHLVRTNDSSFPSGHAATSAAAARVLAELTGAPKTACAAIALGVGTTRIYLGVHHPSDVVGGWLIGWTWASLMAALLRPDDGRHQDAGRPTDAEDATTGPLGYSAAQWSAVAAAKASDAGHPVTG